MKDVKIKFQDLPDISLIRLSTMLNLNIVPFSKSTVWRFVKLKKFPSPVKISDGIVGWRVGELRKWLENPTGYNIDADS